MRRLPASARRLTRSAIVLILSLVLQVACSGANQPNQAGSGATGQLTREVAARLIGQAPKFNTVRSIALLREGQRGGVREGLWSEQRVLTPLGRQYFAEVVFNIPDNLVSPVKPATRTVTEVTGIADHPLGPSVKEAQFRWKYEGLDELVARLTGQGSEPHTGEALLRLYDDGWRVEDVEVKETARVSFRMDEGRVEAVENARRDTAALERAAMTPTKLLAEYRFAVTPPPQRQRPDPTYNTYEVRVTDVDVTVEEKPFNPNFGSQSRKLGFWQTRGVQVGRPVYAHQGMQLTIESINGNLRVHDNSGNSQQLVALQEQLQAAIAAWNAKYPDRTTWLPANTGGEFCPTPDSASDSAFPVGKWKSTTLSDIPYACFSAERMAMFGDRPEEVTQEPWCNWAADGTGTCEDKDGQRRGRKLTFRWSLEGPSLTATFPAETISVTYLREPSLTCFFDR